MKNCKNCDKAFKPKKKQQVYCSRKCSSVHTKSIKDPIEKFFREKISRLRSNAKNRNKYFDLNWKDLHKLYQKQKGLCFYSKIPLNLIYSSKKKTICPFDQLSVDRIDSDLGYTKDNIVLCCFCMNNFKGQESHRNFLDIINSLNNREITVRFIKSNKSAKIPKKQREGDCGFDLVSVSSKVSDYYIEYDTGICLEIPKGYVGLLFPRSSISKTNLTLCNSVGVIDENYRGPIKLRFRKEGNKIYDIGDRIGQIIIMPYPQVEFEEVDELGETERGDKGWGSSGK